MPRNEVVGPYYFEGLIPNAEIYTHLLNSYFLPILPGIPPETLILRDGAPPHCTCEVPTLLHEKLLGFWNARVGLTSWKAGSRDLRPTNFFFRYTSNIKFIALLFPVLPS